MSRRALIIIGVVVIAVVLVGFVAWRRSQEVFVPMDDAEFLKANPSEKEITRYLKNMEEAYKNDTYGGNTPEETLNLFIGALKKGDTDLAAKYFIVEKQAQMREELKQGLKSGGVNTLAAILERPRSGNYLSDTRYEFNTFDKNNVAEFGFVLFLNPLTKKWKLENL